MKTQRDIFISELFKLAKEDKNIILISVDMGAPSLDIWREELPDQFIAAGISEQNAINVAAGLSKAGKKVYVYFMAAWVARCFEQIRYSCAMANNPITILGNGVALGYAPAGPAHEPNEDIAYMRSINNIEIYSPANLSATKELVNLTYNTPKLRYIRLERNYANQVEEYSYNINNTVTLLKPGLKEPHNNDCSVLILSSGYMLGRACDVWKNLIDKSIQTSVIDIWRIKPLDKKSLLNNLNFYTHIVTIEEQTLDGGFGSAICEVLGDYNINKPILRLGLPERFIFENGTRDYLIDNNGLSVNEITNKIEKFIK
jgi:transketolase